MKPRVALALVVGPFTWAAACTLDGLDAYTSGDGGAIAIDGGGKDALVLDGPVTADAPGDAPSAPCNLAAPFGAPAPLASLNTTRLEGQAALSPDERTVYFESDRLNKGSNVFTASRASRAAAFGAPAPLDSLNFMGADTWNAALTADALTAYVTTDQCACPEGRMYKMTRASTLASFGNQTVMPGAIAKGAQPYVLPDGTVLYYSDLTTGPKGFIARAVLGANPTPVKVDLVGPGAHDVGIPVVTPDERTLYFAVFDASGPFDYDVWVATRASANDPWGTAQPVGELNTKQFEAPSWVSPDGCRLYFTRVMDEAGSNWDLFVTSKP